jgi:hypothetical protein
LVTAPAPLRERLEPLRRGAMIMACAALRPGPLHGRMAAVRRQKVGAKADATRPKRKAPAERALRASGASQPRPES